MKVEDSIELFPEDFEFFKQAIGKLAGISLSPAKTKLVQARIRKHLNKISVPDFREYRKLLERLPEEDPEWQHFINLLTTNKTDWFREAAHFDYLVAEFLPHWKSLGKKELKVWCAAASTGEEAYTISMILRRHLSEGCKYKILATDVDTNVLSIAQNGVYQRGPVESHVPPDYVKEAFLQGTGEISDWMKVKPCICESVRFERLNLIEGSYPWVNEFDLIFCRNVFIYFSRETIAQVAAAIAETATPQSALLISHSETLYNSKAFWKMIRPSIFAPVEK